MIISDIILIDWMINVLFTILMLQQIWWVLMLNKD